jgi:hypothetical protein
MEESVKGVLGTLEKAERGMSGTFQSYDGSTLPW